MRAEQNFHGTVEQVPAESENESKEIRNLMPSSPASIVPPNTNMGKKGKRVTTGHTTATLLQHLTTASHACVLLFVILIIYFCFSGEFQFFTWHPLLLSIGWMFLMTEGIFSMSQYNLFTGTLPKVIRVRLHWIIQIFALILIAVGFAVVYITKNSLNKSHFKTWHGLLGFIGIICTIPTAINGTAALYNISLRQYVKSKLVKLLHITSGVVTFTFGGIALILSVYTKWFGKHSNENIITFVLGLLFVSMAVVGTLVRPVITWYNRI